jgi:hypothetical protein
MATVVSELPTFVVVGGSPLVAGSTSTSFSFEHSGKICPQTHVTFQVTTFGAPTSYSIQPQVSLDNVNWYTLPGGPITADGIYLRAFPPESVGTGTNSTNPIVFLDNRAAWVWVRTVVTAVTGGTSPTYHIAGCIGGKHY